MNKISRAVALATLGSGAMLMSGGAMAAGTPLPGLFTINTASNISDVIAGTLTACPTGSVCTDLPGTSAGVSMRTVQNTTSGISYIQTIVAEDLGGGGVFANEQTVQQGLSGGQNATNIAQKMIIDDVAAGFNAVHQFTGDGYSAALSADPYFILSQTVDLGGGIFSKARIQGAINGGGGNVCDTGGTCDNGLAATQTRKVYIDQVGGIANPEFGDFAYRWANTTAGFTNVDLYGGLGGGVADTGPVGTNVGALFITQSVPGVDPGDQDFGIMKYYGLADAIGIVSAFNGLGSGDPTAIFEMDVPALGMTAASSADGYGTWGVGSAAAGIFGAINDYTDFAPVTMP